MNIKQLIGPMAAALACIAVALPGLAAAEKDMPGIAEAL
jgi:hypothetical protein